MRPGCGALKDTFAAQKGRRVVYTLGTKHHDVVVLKYHVPHIERVKKYVVKLRLQYAKVTQRGLVILVGDFNYDPRRAWEDTKVDKGKYREVVNMGPEDVSYNCAMVSSHDPAPEGSLRCTINTVYVDPKRVDGRRWGTGWGRRK